MNEDAIIQRASAFPHFHPTLQLGIEDDAAILSPEPGQKLVWAVDALVENTHFLRAMPAYEIGWKALAVNLSDLASMNAQPLAALLVLALPPDLPPSWSESFFAGLEACCRAYRVDLAGGDTVRQSSEIQISISLLGQSPKPITRRGAQSGDLLAVTGAFGGAAAGLHCFQQGRDLPALLSRHWHPLPRFEAAAHLAALKPTRLAMLDTSDGLSRSLQLLAELNGLGCRVERQRIPIEADVLKYFSPEHFPPEQFWSWVLNGGEEYELMAALPPDCESALAELDDWQVIGRLTAEPGLVLWEGEACWELGQGELGFQHF